MIEYTTALILVILTYLVAIVNIKLYIFSIIIILIDVFTLIPDLVMGNGTVIIGYSSNGAILTPLLMSFSWLRLIAILGIALCSMTAIMKMTGGFD